MSIHVLDQVLDHSRASGVDLCVMVAIAETAHHDGVSWIPLEPPVDRPTMKCLTGRAHCSKREAIRALAAAVDRGELEIRKAQRGRRRISVYRVTVGRIAGAEVDYDRLPFELDQPFGRGDNLAPRQEGDEVTAGNDGVTVPARRGDNLSPDEVPSRHPALTRAGSAAEASVKASREASQDHPLSEPAAAEPVRRSEVVAAGAQLRGWDEGSVKQVERWAALLPRQVFLEKVERVRERGHRLTNPVGLLVHLLRDEVAVRSQQLIGPTAPLAREERTDARDRLEAYRTAPERWVYEIGLFHTDEVFEQLLALGAIAADGATRQRLRELRRRELERLHPGSETRDQALRRWVEESQLPPDDVHAVIDSWDDLDDVDRQDLHELADAIRAQRNAREANAA